MVIPRCSPPQPARTCRLLGNRIGDEGGKALGEALKTNTALTSLKYAARAAVSPSRVSCRSTQAVAIARCSPPPSRPNPQFERRPLRHQQDRPRGRQGAWRGAQDEHDAHHPQVRYRSRRVPIPGCLSHDPGAMVIARCSHPPSPEPAACTATRSATRAARRLARRSRRTRRSPPSCTLAGPPCPHPGFIVARSRDDGDGLMLTSPLPPEFAV